MKSQAKRCFSNVRICNAPGPSRCAGATNRILSLTDDEKSRGVVAFSSGNHAQAVALAA
jgi:threonine dehydratase